MFNNEAYFDIGEIAKVVTPRYLNQSTTSNAITVNDGGHYINKSDIITDQYHYHSHRTVDPLKELSARVTVGAMHNSEHRAEAPKCHEETRKAVQDDIFGWITHGRKQEQPQGLLWLTGPAGSGKTAIMGTICDRLEKKGQLAASFYFASYTNSVERKSKRGFVTTIAYQLQEYTGLKERITALMMKAILDHPVVFKMSLKEQAEKLILRPLRESELQQASEIDRPIVIVDGIDECGEDEYDDPDHSPEKDQLEILSVLLQAIQDPAFPCQIIVASRPETWIRRFFDESAAGLVTEIFLNDKYNPDSDIELFLKSKFSDINRRWGYDSSLWPKAKDIQRLVADASGQFIYAATILRFIDSPQTFPKDQLDIVLKIKPPAGQSPFKSLDSLYTEILKSSPRPSESVLWLKAINRIGEYGTSLKISAWTIDRLFESRERQALVVLRSFPSLLYLTEKPTGENYCDYLMFAKRDGTRIRPVDCKSVYSFYHKSFLDYLGDPARCGDAFPDIEPSAVERWIWGRMARVLELNRPEVPINPAILHIFKECFRNFFSWEFQYSKGRMTLPQDALSRCDPTLWLSDTGPGLTPRTLFSIVHKECCTFRPCSAGCRRWRKAISALPSNQWKAYGWSFSTLLLDRFCLKRVKFASPLQGVTGEIVIH